MKHITSSLRRHLFLAALAFTFAASLPGCAEDRSPSEPVDPGDEAGWHDVASGVTTHLYCVGFSSATEGWIAGQRGTILHSTDGGDSWTSDGGGVTNEALYDVDVAGNAVYFCGSGTTLLRGISSPTGYQWNSITIPNGKDFYRRVQFANSSTGWVLETNWHFGLARLWYSFDNMRWAAGTGIPYSEDLEVQDFLFTANLIPDGEDNGKLKHEGWLLAYQGDSPDGTAYLYRTRNGGKSWTVALQDPDTYFSDIHFADAQHGWIAKTWGMLTTTDGGNTWNSHDFTSSLVMPYHLNFIDTQTGWTAMQAEGLYHTRDGGASWAEQAHADGSIWGVNDIHMISTDVGILACRDGKIYRTTTGGR